jgi:hypothetical protein
VKRWLIISLVTFGVLALAVPLGFELGGEAIARRVVVPKIEQRLGVSLEWGAVHTSVGEVVLEDIAVDLPDLPEVRTSIGSLRVRYSFWALLSGELRIEEVLVAAPRIEVSSLDHALLERLGDQIAHVARRSDASLDRAGGFTTGSSVRVSGGEIALRLVERSIVQLERIDGTLGGDGRFDCRIDAARIWGSAQEPELATLGPILASGRRESGRSVVITDVALEGFSFRWVLGEGPNELHDVLLQLQRVVDIDVLARSAEAPVVPEGARPDVEEGSRITVPGSITVNGGEIALVWAGGDRSPWQVGLTGVQGDVLLGDDGGPPIVRLEGSTRPGDGRIVVSGTLDPDALSLRARVDALRIAQLTDGISFENLQFDDASFLDGNVEVAMEPDHVLAFEGEIETTGLSVRSGLLAPVPLEALRVRVVADGRVRFQDRQIELQEARTWINGVEVQLEGNASRTPEYTTVELRAALATVACAELLRATPAPLRDRIGDLELEGSIGGRFHLALDTRRLEDTVLELELTNGCRATGRGDLAIERLYGAFWHRVELPGDEVYEFTTGPGSGSWAALDQISPFMVAAVLTTEDGGFFYHHGFSLREIRNALIRDVEAGGPRFGASTITMQLARNLYLYRGRNLARKLQEAVLTWYLEQHLSKEEILALYLNVIEFGPEVFGIRAAAMHYFGRQPDDLSPREAVFLARLLPSPVARHEETYEEGELSARWEARLDRILNLMRERRSLTTEEHREALAERIVFHRSGDPSPQHRTWRRRVMLPRGAPEDDVPTRPIRRRDGEAHIPPPADLEDDLNGW